MVTQRQTSSDLPDLDRHDTQARRRPWAGLHSSGIKFRFNVPVFDFMLQWIIGAQTHGGSEVGETLYAASQIDDCGPVRRRWPGASSSGPRSHWLAVTW